MSSRSSQELAWVVLRHVTLFLNFSFTLVGSIELVEFHTMLLELMRTSFMQCMADLVQREKVLLINR